MTHGTKSQLNGNKTHHQSTVVEFRSTSCEQWMDHSRRTHPWKSTSAGRNGWTTLVAAEYKRSVSLPILITVRLNE